MGKESVINNIILNQASGDDRIILGQSMSSGVWYCKELIHNCKNITQGIEDLMDCETNIRELLNCYNKVVKKQ